MAIYQITLFLDSIPAAAACNEAVEAGQKDLATGVLPALLTASSVPSSGSRKRETLSRLPEKMELAERISLLHSTAFWLVERWLEELGPKGNRGVMQCQ